jgi:Leucine-rich repeat (LRR) protein
LTTLPENLPASLEVLSCNNNQLTTLPENLPASLEVLYCNNNQLTTLPENLPASLKELLCNENPFTKEYGFKITTETLPRYYLEKEEREKSRGDGMYNAVFK